MEHTKKLYLVDDFDRVYKQLQRPAQAVAKAKSSIRLSRTLADDSLSKDEKVRRYVDLLHRFLHTHDPHTDNIQKQQQQKQLKRTRKPVSKVNTERTPQLFDVSGRSPPALSPQTSLRVLRSQSVSVPSTSKGPAKAAYYVVDDDDDDDDLTDEIFVPITPATTTTMAPAAATTTTTTSKSTAKPPTAQPRTSSSKSKKRTKVNTSDWAVYQ